MTKLSSAAGPAQNHKVQKVNEEHLDIKSTQSGICSPQGKNEGLSAEQHIRNPFLVLMFCQ